jgi:nicotinamidase-related amidase
MDRLGIIKKETTAFVMIDVQEKFVPAISGINEVIKNANILVKASEILKIPLIVTEQYPKGLGSTVKNIRLPENATKIEKIHFSCFGNDEFTVVMDKLKQKKIKSLVVFGIETHVCILKTVLDAMSEGFEVHVVADAASSRTQLNKDAALKRMMQSGAFIATTEMICFQLMDKAGTEEFKEISRLVK